MIDFLVLIAASFAAGIINTVAGGGTLLTFPSLLRHGLPAVLANTTSTVALVPASLAGAWGLRRELVGTGPWLLLLTPPSILGGMLGAMLLLYLPQSYFNHLIPWLLLTAALLFLLQPYLARRFVLRAESGLPSWRVRLLVLLFQLLVAIYGGYFGAGIGILMLTALAFMGLGDIHRMNAVKGILAAAINGTSVLVFVLQGQVVWSLAVLMALGAIGGGLTGAAVGRRLPKGAIRWFVILVGLGLALRYFLKVPS